MRNKNINIKNRKSSFTILGLIIHFIIHTFFHTKVKTLYFTFIFELNYYE